MSWAANSGSTAGQARSAEHEAPASRPTAAVFNAGFDPLTLREAVEAVVAHVRAGQRGWLCTVNVSYLMRMRTDSALQSFVDRAALVVADGQPLVWCAPLFGARLPERVAGIDLLDALCERAVCEDLRVYLLGGTPRVVSASASSLRRRYPGLRLDFSDGYFQPRQAGARADAVARSGADILFVGMGVPLQERFIEEQWSRLGVSMAIGVGGSFDVLAGERKRASPRLQAWGLEWLVRLAQEPRRLLPRYLDTNTRFCGLLLQQLWRKMLTRGTRP